jgi:pyruvate dehydrogenase E1 component
MTQAAHPRPGAGLETREHRLRLLAELERKVLWLSSWIIHHANHVRPNRDGLKVGGHQASSASVVTLLTALYFQVLRPEDRVAVKPHASPVLHAIRYLLGREELNRLMRFRSLGGVQAYPSRLRDGEDVDISTGSVGLGAAMTIFAALVQDFVRLKGLAGTDAPPGRMVAVVGDAELDEGNVFEALLEGWKHDVRNVWWIIDYNRQSLDSIVSDRLFARIDAVFRAMDWRVATLKYGKRLEAAFAEPGGHALRDWIDACPNSLYSALTYKGGAAWREHLRRDLGAVPGVRALLDARGDAELHALMTNLGGHDLETVLEAFADADDERPTAFIAYTIKGFGLPFAGHKDNHAGLMTREQMVQFQNAMGVAPGAEWDLYAGLNARRDEIDGFLADVPFGRVASRSRRGPTVPTPASLPQPSERRMSTQEGFGRYLGDLARTEEPAARHIVTSSPDVTVSTSLGGWVNRRGIFDRKAREDVFREEKVISAQKWAMSPSGQHIELGIAENNLFLLLASLGLSGPLFGARLLPIGTLYDPFIQRGLDALSYACYQDARFILVGTPSGLTLAPEGGQHQSVATPLIGIGQPGLLAYEPSFVDELGVLLAHALRHIQEPDGSSVYLRLSTRPIDQPERQMTPDLGQAVIDGGYWLHAPQEGAEMALVYSGALAPEVMAAFEEIRQDIPGAGLLAVTSANRLHRGWRSNPGKGTSRVERLLAPLASDAALVTVLDGHPLALSWLGAVRGHPVHALGVERFGQSGDIPDLYAEYRLDPDAILNAAAAAVLARLRNRLLLLSQ